MQIIIIYKIYFAPTKKLATLYYIWHMVTYCVERANYFQQALNACQQTKFRKSGCYLLGLVEAT